MHRSHLAVFLLFSIDSIHKIVNTILLEEAYFFLLIAHTNTRIAKIALCVSLQTVIIYSIFSSLNSLSVGLKLFINVKSINKRMIHECNEYID